MEENIILFKTLISILGNKKLLLKVEALELVDKYDEIRNLIAEFMITLEEKFTKHVFEFQDKTNRKLIRHYILTFYGSESLEGEPTIVINDFPPGLKAEKNPVLDLILTYDDFEKRDKDLEKLHLLLN